MILVSNIPELFLPSCKYFFIIFLDSYQKHIVLCIHVQVPLIAVTISSAVDSDTSARDRVPSSVPMFAV